MALSKGNTPELQQMLNFMAPTSITVKPPQISKNKGSGKRIKSAREKAADKVKKDGRKCATCGQQPARHDSRNCLLNPNRKKQGTGEGKEKQSDHPM
nr:protein FAR1-RELATED SEQUENCE 5-like [Ipomoea batatas]